MGRQYIEPMSQRQAAVRLPIGGHLGTRLRSLLQTGLGWRLPRPCAVCGQWAASGLCGDCEARFVQQQPARCPRCALAQPGGLACGACLREPPPYVRCIALADYGFPWDRLIAHFKFQGRVDIAALLADLLARRLHETLIAGAAPSANLVLPVPLSAHRLAERGFNQAWELARRVAARAQLPARADLLLRPWDSAHQADLGRSERQLNLRTAFMVDPRQRAALQGQRVALVDDVMTTGATAREAAAVLLRCGASAVQVWVIARTPDRG